MIDQQRQQALGAAQISVMGPDYGCVIRDSGYLASRIAYTRISYPRIRLEVSDFELRILLLQSQTSFVESMNLDGGEQSG